MKNNKRKSTVLIKLLGPVIALGLLTMITAVVGLQSMISVQKQARQYQEMDSGLLYVLMR